MKQPLVEAVAVGLGTLLVLNGLYMLVAPEHWYFAIPGVPDRGSYNVHFIRDIGIIYALCGAALISGALFWPAQRLGLWTLSALWLTGHALFHFWEIGTGFVGLDSLLVDFPGVTLPALVNLVLLRYATPATTAPPSA